MISLKYWGGLAERLVMAFEHLAAAVEKPVEEDDATQGRRIIALERDVLLLKKHTVYRDDMGFWHVYGHKEAWSTSEGALAFAKEKMDNA